ncbi:MAG: bifunctional adenosylcobinamide kinase/adenosylcobinamide-phosphate guanylyltransferase [Rhizobiales bacterium]|nr:bifunctional adenosylcobinamide kinase/adenosylcobinamide-phosphate guanylyltransferase [Hyphomicrobiales bacterium]
MAGAAAHVLVLGGRRSGKSRFAEDLVLSSGLAPVYVATATPGDGEMAARIAAHRGRRGGAWRTIETPLLLADAIRGAAVAGNAVLVDCLTLWLANLMEGGADLAAETGGLVATLEQAEGPVVFVSNEVGAGIIPDNALARAYSDAHGILNQRVAAAVGRVVLVTAGLPLLLKPSRQGPITL